MDKRAGELDVGPPRRKKRCYTQTIHAEPRKVFPLLCPVRELEWVPGWSPDWVRSDSGFAEEGCVFQTPGEPAPAIWVVTRCDPKNYRVEMIKVTPGHTVGRIEISLEAAGDSGTRARVCYEFTAIGPAGDQFIEEFTEQWYERFMQGWERAINHYLETGAPI